MHGGRTIRLAGFDQDQELARLRTWLAKVRSRSERKLICSAIEELIRRNLVRYGRCRGSVGFGVIGEWATLEAWAQTIFYPSDPVGYGIMRGLCNPRIKTCGNRVLHGQSRRPDLHIAFVQR